MQKKRRRKSESGSGVLRSMLFLFQCSPRSMSAFDLAWNYLSSPRCGRISSPLPCPISCSLKTCGHSCMVRCSISFLQTFTCRQINTGTEITINIFMEIGCWAQCECGRSAFRTAGVQCFKMSFWYKILQYSKHVSLDTKSLKTKVEMAGQDSREQRIWRQLWIFPVKNRGAEIPQPIAPCVVQINLGSNTGITRSSGRAL
mmetsp:Transcript_46499/g.95099  ORF Transcript_46499/g.95099 Transcript_46499/m.95099 type:complete len:201 (-) Transcript_46499:1685-2287(-)